MRKAYNLVYSSIPHGGELIIMLIIIVLLYDVIMILYVIIKKASRFLGRLSNISFDYIKIIPPRNVKSHPK